MRGGEAAEQRPLAARQHRRQVPRLDARRTMADAIDPRMLAAQGAGMQAVPELCGRHAGAEQLRASDNAVLS